ncbi:MAG: hypothetical protein KAR42_16605 [candidate division Zixibacteria bacterium]|nr:hypothetical protein [candidate division Zixibacteria bacterium]
MQFVVIAYDGTDEQALERRMAVREEHIKKGKELFEAGKWLYAAGILDDDGQMVGSMIICDYESKEQMHSEWLESEPYITGDVWKTLLIDRTAVAPFCGK